MAFDSFNEDSTFFYNINTWAKENLFPRNYRQLSRQLAGGGTLLNNKVYWLVSLTTVMLLSFGGSLALRLFFHLVAMTTSFIFTHHYLPRRFRSPFWTSTLIGVVFCAYSDLFLSNFTSAILYAALLFSLNFLASGWHDIVIGASVVDRVTLGITLTKLTKALLNKGLFYMGSSPFLCTTMHSSLTAGTGLIVTLVSKYLFSSSPVIFSLPVERLSNCFQGLFDFCETLLHALRFHAHKNGFGHAHHTPPPLRLPPDLHSSSQDESFRSQGFASRSPQAARVIELPGCR